MMHPKGGFLRIFDVILYASQGAELTGLLSALLPRNHYYNYSCVKRMTLHRITLNNTTQTMRGNERSPGAGGYRKCPICTDAALAGTWLPGTWPPVCIVDVGLELRLQRFT